MTALLRQHNVLRTEKKKKILSNIILKNTAILFCRCVFTFARRKQRLRTKNEIAQRRRK